MNIIGKFLKISFFLIYSFEKHTKSVAYVRMMGITSLSYCLTYSETIVTDNIFRFVSDLISNLLQNIFNACSIPTLCNRNINNSNIFFRNCRTGINGRHSKCKQKFFTAYHHAFINNQSISLVFE